MELSKINTTGFYFRKSNCEWTVNHEADSFPVDFIFESFDLETLTMSGTLASEQLSFWESYIPEPEAVEEDEPEAVEKEEPEEDDPKEPEKVGPPIYTIVFTQEQVEAAKAKIV